MDSPQEQKTLFLGDGVYYTHDQYPDARYLSLYSFGDRVMLGKSAELSLLGVILADLPQLADLQQDRGRKILHLVGGVLSELGFLPLLSQPDTPLATMNEQARASLIQHSQQEVLTSLAELTALVEAWRAEISASLTHPSGTQETDSSSRVSP
jgi:hypothetical protein